MKRTAKRPLAAGFGLSFLDVLCCGLGSTVLLLLIVKHGLLDTAVADTAFVAAQTQSVRARVAAAESRREQLRSRLATQEKALAQDMAALQTLAEQQSSQALQYTSLLEQLGAERATLTENAANLRALQVVTEEPEEVNTRPYKRQLTGINLEEDRVAIFLDRSASMLHRSLVEIIRLRASAEAVRRKAGKWVAAQAAAHWAYRQLPDRSRFQFFTYADDLRDIDSVPLQPGGRVPWRIKGQPGSDNKAINATLARSMPGGPTDLKQVFETAAKLVPRPKQVLILTDGYPTLPGNTRLARLRGCSKPKKGVTPVLSPTCRLSVYLNAIAVVNKRLAGVPVDVILFPLDGDADAVHGYWLLTALSGGRMLTPADGWP